MSKQRSWSGSITETARRRQIIDAAIATIAEGGIAQASYARIAERAGLSSTGLISYHFAGRSDLIDAVVARVVADGQAYMLPRIDSAAPGAARLRAYLTSNLEFMVEHPDDILAVAEILGAMRTENGGQPPPYAPFHAKGLGQLEEYLREGQQSGAFRTFDTSVMAIAIRAAIDEAAYRYRTDDSFDPVLFGRELADIFERAAIAATGT